MKKVIVAFLAGVAVATAGTAYGNEAISTMLGKKVQVEYDVIVNGNKLDVKAIAIDGKSYAPIRAFSESVDYDLAFTNNTVILNDPALEGSEPMNTESPSTDPVSEPIQMSQDDIDAIKSSEEQIRLSEQRIIEYTDKLKELNAELEKAELEVEQLSDRYEKELAEMKVSSIKSTIEGFNFSLQAAKDNIPAQQAYIEKIKAKYATQAQQ